MAPSVGRARLAPVPLATFCRGLTSDPSDASQALVTAGLLSRSQLLQLGANTPVVALAPPGNSGLAWLRTFDLSLARPFRFKDRFVAEPSISVFNILNFANFDGPGNRLSGILNGTIGSLNGTSGTDRTADRISPGSGMFSFGAPRQIQFGVKLTF
jgi:hypothetical protein